MNQMIKFGLILGVICLSATLVLAVTYQVTKPKIEKQLSSEENLALKDILPEADSFNEKRVGEIGYFEAIKEKRVVGYCVKVTGNGYSGFMRIVVGIDLNGAIKGVEVLEHQETPGLGAKIVEVRAGETKPWFLKQFIGKSAQTVEIKKNIDAITGATISSKGVTDAVNKAVTEFLAKVKR